MDSKKYCANLKLTGVSEELRKGHCTALTLPVGLCCLLRPPLWLSRHASVVYNAVGHVQGSELRILKFLTLEPAACCVFSLKRMSVNIEYPLFLYSITCTWRHMATQDQALQM